MDEALRGLTREIQILTTRLDNFEDETRRWFQRLDSRFQTLEASSRNTSVELSRIIASSFAGISVSMNALESSLNYTMSSVESTRSRLEASVARLGNRWDGSGVRSACASATIYCLFTLVVLCSKLNAFLPFLLSGLLCLVNSPETLN